MKKNLRKTKEENTRRAEKKIYETNLFYLLYSLLHTPSLETNVR